MHAIQTSGNCIRNTSADHFAGAAADEVADPRIYAEIIRQWSTLHPEFAFLPRKFKICVVGAEKDRAAMKTHDIGIQVKRNDAGEIGFGMFVGGGQGRTPMIAKPVNDFVAENDLIAYCEAILRVYNMYGRRDNKYKARIKILVHETGIDELRKDIEAEFERIKDGVLRLPDESIRAIETYFADPAFEELPAVSKAFEKRLASDPSFAIFAEHNLHAHKKPGYTSVVISVKPAGAPPGDATDEQLEAMADIGEKYSFDELRITHEQNVILPHVKLDELPAVYDELVAAKLHSANAGLITDMIVCPGLDYCALANARSIPVAQRLSQRFEDIQRQKDIGELKLKISGCINACGHHHVGHIGILGVDRKGEELYQITLGGSGDENTSIGKIAGRGFTSEQIVDAVETVVDTYINVREKKDESFIETYRRVGDAPFKEALYG